MIRLFQVLIKFVFSKHLRDIKGTNRAYRFGLVWFGVQELAVSILVYKFSVGGFTAACRIEVIIWLQNIQEGLKPNKRSIIFRLQKISTPPRPEKSFNFQERS